MTKRESKRLLRLYKDRQIIADLRKHFEGYSLSDGFSLTPKKIAELPYSKRRSIRRKHDKLQELLKKPFVDFVTTEDDASRKAVKQYLKVAHASPGANMRGLKHFIVPKPSAESNIEVRAGKVQIRQKFPGEKGLGHVERFFYFPSTPRGPGHMMQMFDKLYKSMPAGMYEVLTDSYGSIMLPIDREQLRDEVLRLLEAYDNPKYNEDRFLYRIIGFRFTAMTVKNAMIAAEKRIDARAGQREHNRKIRERIAKEISEAKQRSKKK
jgi:hypothetical protein